MSQRTARTVSIAAWIEARPAPAAAAPPINLQQR